MKKIISVMLCVFFAFVSAAAVTAADSTAAPKIGAEAYALYCADNGQLVCSKKQDERMKPASTTKLMTALITLEHAAAADKPITFTQEMTAEGSSMYLKIGDRLKLSDLAAGMMMASGNDAANAAAISIAGSTEKFAQLMNERAKQIGMKNTHFVTPSGLDDDNHYSTARDMALLMAYALENEDFAKLTSQKSITVNFLNPASKKTTYANHNRLLSMYEYCTGGKTGYTMAAGRCLVTAAKKDGLTLVCVTLNDRNDWNDQIELYDYGFDKLMYYQADDSAFCADIPCVGGTADKVAVTGEKRDGFVIDRAKSSKVKRTVYIDSFLYAPVIQSEVVGRVEYTLDNKLLHTSKLLAAETVESVKKHKNIFTKIKEFFTYG